MEDPSEAFEDLRDKCDLRMLFKLPEFLKEAYGLPEDVDMSGAAVNISSGTGKLGPPTNKEWAERWRKQLKIASVSLSLAPIADGISQTSPILQRQFSRLIEMLLLRSLKAEDVKRIKAYRLQVRVYMLGN